MMKFQKFFFFIFVYTLGIAQHRDSIFLKASLSEDLKELIVNQRIIFHNKSNETYSKIKFLNWTMAYKNEKTALKNRQLEDRKKALYFAKKEELPEVKYLKFFGNSIPNVSDENLFLSLPKSLLPNETIEIPMEYAIRLPHAKFTSFGYDDNGASLKYFFIVPESLETYKETPRPFYDMGERGNAGSYWQVKIDTPSGYFVDGNLEKISEQEFRGFLTTDAEFSFQKKSFHNIVCKVSGRDVETIFGYPLTTEEESLLRFYLPLQLSFIHRELGILPSKIFISNRTKNEEDFFGNDDIRFWKFRFKMFSDGERLDLDYFSIISKEVLKHLLILDKNKDHWLENGLKTFLEIKYLKANYSEAKLLGHLPEHLSLWGIKPLNWFHASQLGIRTRYGLFYEYMMEQNLDQPIFTPFAKMSNFNNLAISSFETGNLFTFISDKVGEKQFRSWVKTYIAEHLHKTANGEEFLLKLKDSAPESTSFLGNFMSKKQRVNFDIKQLKQKDKELWIDIDKNTDLPIPFRLTTETKIGEKKHFWFDTKEKGIHTYRIPNDEIYKILVNEDYAFPEANHRDNYLYTKGFFANMKKIKLRLFEDIPNPEYNEIYISPKWEFNAYDGLLLGASFTNESLFYRDFGYSISPYYSTGTGALTGSGSAGYTYRPTDKFFQSWSLGASVAHFHYDRNLSYQKLTIASVLTLRKEPRSTINNRLVWSYGLFQKDLTHNTNNETEYSRYNLWNIGYVYSDNKLINESFWATNIQLMDDYKKISAEYFHRWEYALNRKIAFRFFGGYFFNNNAKNHLFDFGISRVSNYSFGYSLLGQSAKSGLLSQEFILAEGGFKSMLGSYANQWITSVNIDGNLWKMFNLYTDFGVYKNKNHSPKFIYDTGVKLKIIPDFFEVYFPLQSSLGFEPLQKSYARKIRFSLILSLSGITNYFRRGWY